MFERLAYVNSHFPSKLDADPRERRLGSILSGSQVGPHLVSTANLSWAAQERRAPVSVPFEAVTCDSGMLETGPGDSGGLNNGDPQMPTS